MNADIQGKRYHRERANFGCAGAARSRLADFFTTGDTEEHRGRTGKIPGRGSPCSSVPPVERFWLRSINPPAPAHATLACSTSAVRARNATWGLGPRLRTSNRRMRSSRSTGSYIPLDRKTSPTVSRPRILVRLEFSTAEAWGGEVLIFSF